jgi:hypothetical protein
MSAATRRPYLTEGVHVAVENGGSKSCQAAYVSEIGPVDAVELWVLKKPDPQYLWMKYDAAHRNGTWHYAH